MNFNIGDVVEGNVVKLIQSGAFVKISEEKVGFLHISELSYSFVKEVSKIIKVGDIIKVKVISIGPENKIGLSIKQLSPFKKEPQNKEEKQLSFEDMMKNFKAESEQKMSDIKKNINNKQKGSRRSKG